MAATTEDAIGCKRGECCCLRDGGGCGGVCKGEGTTGPGQQPSKKRYDFGMMMMR